MSRWVAVALTVILLLAGFLRVHGTSTRGLTTDDEGLYAQGVQTYSAVATYAAMSLVGSQRPTFVTYFSEHGGSRLLSDKPTFVFLGFLASLLISARDYTLIAVSSVFGLLTVAITFAIARVLGNRRDVGLVAALFLAVSPLHLAYSRTAFSDITGAAVAWLALWLYLLFLESPESRPRYRVAAALLAGAAFTTHPSLLWLPVPFVGAELWRAWRMQRWGLRRVVSSVASFAVWSAVPSLAWEAATQGIRAAVQWKPAWAAAAAASEQVASLSFASFLEYTLFSAGYNLTVPSPINAGVAPEYGYYFTLLFRHEGGLICALAVVGAVLVSRRWLTGSRSLQGVLTSVFLWLPLGLYSVIYYYPKHPAPRFLLIAMPAFVLLAAVAVADIAAWGSRALRVRQSWALAGVLACLVALLQWPAVPEILAIQSAYPRVIAYMAQHEGVRHISDQMFIARTYVGRQNAIDHYVSLRVSDEDRGYRHISLEKIEKLYEAGYRYFVRASGSFYSNELVRLTGGSYLEADTGCRHPVDPVLVLFHPQGEYWPPEIRHSERDAHVPHELRVYRLKDLIDRLEGDGISTCT